MLKIQNKEECCGCTACKSVCPVKCITFQEDEEGFSYPVIDEECCIDCHKCEIVCPVNNVPVRDDMPTAYLTRTKNENILQKSTSGGVFSEIAAETIKSGGVVYGVIYDDDFIVRHARITDSVGMRTLPGSKYVQSDLGDCFSAIKEDLDRGLQAVFCGTPCQVAGLYNFLGKEYENLILVDLVCHGVPSPKLWRRYLEFIEDNNGKLEYANFRSKYLGYHVAVMEERFSGGKTKIGSARTNLMLKCFFKNVADRPICYSCPFKTIPRCSDLTLFDGWHAGEYVDGLKDDDRGYTIVLTHTFKGREAAQNGGIFTFFPIDLNKAIKLDGRMANNSVELPKERAGFYSLLEKEGIERTIELLFPISKSDYYIEKIKVMLNKLGFLENIRSFTKK